MDLFIAGTRLSHLAMFWLLSVFVSFCLISLMLTLWRYIRYNRNARRAAELASVYDNLVKSVRYGLATDDDIQRTVTPRDFPHFRHYLNASISSIKHIDVSAHLRIAAVCGYIDHLIRRAEGSRRWARATAIRELSYFRDPRNIPLFERVASEDRSVQSVFSAAVGLALCGDTRSFRSVAERLWTMTGRNQEAMLTLFAVHGDAIAPELHALLRLEQLRDEARALIVSFLGGVAYRAAASDIAGMLAVETSTLVLAACLNALRHLADGAMLKQVLPFLCHDDFSIRIGAVHAVAKAGGDDGLPFIEAVLGDANWWVRREAALAMASLGRTGIARLKAAASGDIAAPRQAATGILAELLFNRIADGRI